MPYAEQNDLYKATGIQKIISPETPASRVAVVSPHDQNDLSPYAKSLRVQNTASSAQAIVYLPKDNADGSTITATIAANTAETIPVQVRRVLATGTASSNFVIHAYFDGLQP